MHLFIIYILIFIGIIIIPQYVRFSQSNYSEVSGNTFFKTVFNKGNNGEFLTFYTLEKMKEPKILLTNVYVPKADGSTTEIDLIMLAETGIYVFESKNYSGWIFGDEKYKNWTQTLPNKQKFKFFNPIWQNNAHINALKATVELDDVNLFKSYIIFSERCTLKKISVTSPNVKVMKRELLEKYVKRDFIESEKVLMVEQISALYTQLKPFTLANDETKKAHIDNVKLKQAGKS